MSNIRPFGARYPQIDLDAYVDERALVIGDVTIGRDSSIWPMAVIRGDVHGIRIGRATSIQDGAVLHVSHDSRFLPGGRPLVLGDGITVGHQATLHGCEIGDYCLVGIGARVLDGAVLAPRTLLGAGSLVSPGKRLEGGYLWVGAPARRVRALGEQELAYLEYSAGHYVRLARQYLAAQRGEGRQSPPGPGDGG